MATSDVIVEAVTFENELAVSPKPIKKALGVLLGKEHRIKETKPGAPAFSLVRYAEGASRGNDGVLETYGLVFDFDHLPIAAANEVVRKSNGTACAIYSTFSHKEKGPEDNCFRLIFPTSRPIGKAEFPAVWSSMNKRLGGLADPHASDISRIWFFPFCPSERRESSFIRYRDGELLDPEQAKSVEQVNRTVVSAGKIPEGTRNAHLASLAGTLRRKGVGQETIAATLLKENQCCCDPPLSDADVRRIARSIARYDPQPSSNSPLIFVPIRELLAKPRQVTNWVVEGLLPQGGLSMIVAKPKVGKSTLMRELALSVARGKSFLGRKTFQGTVLYMALEEREADVLDHFRRMGATDEPIQLFAKSASPNILNELREIVSREHPALIIVDTLARVTGIRDINDYAQVTARLTPLLDVAHVYNCHVCLVHHAKKSDAEAIDMPLGSTALGGSVDTILVMKRKDEYRIICSIQRTGEDLPESVLSFDKERGYTSLAGTREEVEVQACEGAILQYLHEQSSGVSEKTIKEDVPGDNRRKQTALRLLVADGRVIRSGAGKKGNEYLYQLAKNSLLLTPLDESEQVRIEEVGVSGENHDEFSHFGIVDPEDVAQSEHL